MWMDKIRELLANSHTDKAVNNHTNKPIEYQWPSHRGFSIDENHYVMDDDMTADEEKSIYEEINAFDRESDIFTGGFDAQPSMSMNDGELEELDFLLDADESLDADVITLPVGTILMRFGSEGGQYLTIPGTKESQVALPSPAQEIHYYKTEQPLQVHAGTARPFFGQEGGGVQYVLLGNRKISDLLGDADRMAVLQPCDEKGESLHFGRTEKHNGQSSESHPLTVFSDRLSEGLKSVGDAINKNGEVLLRGCVCLTAIVALGNFHINVDKIKSDTDQDKAEQIVAMAQEFQQLEDTLGDDDLDNALKNSNSVDFDIDKPLSSISPPEPPISEENDKEDITEGQKEMISTGDDAMNLFSSYEDRIKHTPSMDSGRWSGERGESLCSARSNEAQEILSEHGLSGIEYRDGIPDFSPLSYSTVQLGYMTDSRHNSGTDGRDNQNTIYTHFGPNGEVDSVTTRADKESMADIHMKYDKPGNFEQSDILTAQQWSQEMKDGHEWSAKDVAEYRQTHQLTWHECNDGTTMMLIPRVINDEFDHLGGVAELKARDRIVDEAIRGTEYDVEYDEGDPTSGMTDDEVTEYFEHIWAEQDQYNEMLSSTQAESEVQEHDPIEALAQYYADHNYGPDDAAVYQNDPEWQQLQKAAYPDYDIPSAEPISSVRMETVDASSIGGIDTSDSHFWDHHGNTKEDYLAIASKLPEVQDLLNQGISLDEIKEIDELHDCVVAYYDPSHMVKVEQGEQGLEFRDDGRHRIAAAQELGLQVPVQIIERNPDTSQETSAVAAPITVEQQAEAFDALAKYMNDHNYGMEDYAEYSQDPEWQALHEAAYGHPVIDTAEDCNPEVKDKLESLYNEKHNSEEVSEDVANPADSEEQPEEGSEDETEPADSEEQLEEVFEDEVEPADREEQPEEVSEDKAEPADSEEQPEEVSEDKAEPSDSEEQPEEVSEDETEPADSEEQPEEVSEDETEPADSEEQPEEISEDETEPADSEEQPEEISEDEIEPADSEEQLEEVSEDEVEPADSEEQPEEVSEDETEPADREEQPEEVSEDEAEPSDREEQPEEISEDKAEPSDSEEQPEEVSEDETEPADSEEQPEEVSEDKAEPSDSEEQPEEVSEDEVEPADSEEQPEKVSEDETEPADSEEQPEEVSEDETEPADSEEQLEEASEDGAEPADSEEQPEEISEDETEPADREEQPEEVSEDETEPADSEEQPEEVSEDEAEPSDSEEQPEEVSEDEVEPADREEQPEEISEDETEPADREEQPEEISEDETEPADREEQPEEGSEDETEPADSEEQPEEVSEDKAEPSDSEEQPEAVSEDEVEPADSEEQPEEVSEDETEPADSEEQPEEISENDADPAEEGNFDGDTPDNNPESTDGADENVESTEGAADDNVDPASEELMDELADNSEEGEQLISDEVDDSGISDELISEEESIDDTTLIDTTDSQDIAEELESTDDTNEEINIGDSDLPPDNLLTSELDGLGSGTVDEMGEDIDTSNVESELASIEGDDEYEQLSIDGFDEDELETIGSEEAMDDLSESEVDTPSVDQIDGQMGFEDITSNVESAPISTGDGSDGNIA